MARAPNSRRIDLAWAGGHNMTHLVKASAAIAVGAITVAPAILALE